MDEIKPNDLNSVPFFLVKLRLMGSETLSLRHDAVDSDQGAARARCILLLRVSLISPGTTLNNHAISTSPWPACGTHLASVLGAVHDFRAEGTV